MSLEARLSKVIVAAVTSILLIEQVPTVRAQSAACTQITEAATARLPRRTTVAILPVRDGRLDESGDLDPLVEETASSLRQLGHVARTIRELSVARTAHRTIGRSGPVGRASVGRFGTALGVGAIILLALAGARENEMSVTTSIYSSTGGVFDEIWRSKVGWREEGRVASPSQGVARCTGNLLTNGNFERDWPYGWKRSYGDIEQGSSVTEVTRGTGSNILHMKHVGLSDVSLFQIARVPKGQIIFQFEAKFSTREGPIMGFSGTGTAGISLILLDANQNTLGLLWAGNYVRNIFEGTGLVGVPHGPRDTNSASFLEMPNGRTVRERFNVSKFVRDRMGKIDVDRIEYIAVNISLGATDNNAGAEAWIDNLSLEVCPY